MARLQDLEHAACDVIQNVKQIQDLRHTRLSVIGGLALMHYLPEYRSTDNINFITNISTSPSSLKKRLLERPASPFFQRSQALFYRSPDGQEFRIDISPEWLSPYLPEAAVKVHEIPYGEVPYISLIDLIVFKLDSSGLRSNPAKKERDARDAAALVDLAVAKGSIELTKKQEQVVEEALCDVAKCGTKEKGWWERCMGLGRGVTLKPPYDSRGGGGGQRRQSRPHSKSDPSPSRSPTAYDPNAAWHYERLDHAHIRRFNSLHSSRNAGRPGPERSASHRMVRDTGCRMTRPKTTHSSLRVGPRRSGYTLEPRGSSTERPSQTGYFGISRTPPGGLGTVTEHSTVGGRRSSRAGYFDLGLGGSPGTVARPRRPPGLEKRSVTFLL